MMLFMLTYVATFVPFNVCFNPPSDGLTFSDIIDIFVDCFFFADLIVNFLSAYEDSTTGALIVDLKLIAKNYTSTWFMLDLVAIIPVEIFESLLGGS